MRGMEGRSAKSAHFRESRISLRTTSAITSPQAGLFSAVVTAFLVQACQSLQSTQTEILLAEIAHFTIQDPSDSTIRVNTCWFLSLILSLITVLVGIVSLQWLREFQNYTRNLSSRKILAMRTMRSEAFQRWFVPQIFAGLPLLLQLALVLFFVGLVDYLFALNPTVALPVTILIASTFLFLFLTTTLPSVQSFVVLSSPDMSSIPSECPYKSPQSWAFLRLCSSLPIRTMLDVVGFFVFGVAIFPLSPLILVLRIWDRHYSLWMLVERLRFALHLKYLGTLNNWHLFDIFWLDRRETIATRSSLPATGHLTKAAGNADYDAARGLSHIINSDAHDDVVALAVYHCFQELPLAVCQDDIFDLMIEDLPDWVKAERASRMSPSLKSPSNTMIRCENEVFLLARLPQTANSHTIHIFRKRQLEVFIRTLSYIFTDEPWEQYPQIEHRVTADDTTSRSISPGRLLIPTCLKSMRGFASLPEPLCTGKFLSWVKFVNNLPILLDLKEQLLTIYESFVQNTLSNTISDDLATLGLRHKEEVLGDFMQVIQTVVLSLISCNAQDKDSNSKLLSKFISIINRLSQHLLRNSETQTESRVSLDQHFPNALGTPSSAATILVPFHISVLCLSRFDYTAWAHIRHREPEFAEAFRSFVFAARVCERDVIGKVKFDFQHLHYHGQWRKLVREVLCGSIPSPRSPESDENQRECEHEAVVDPPPDDCCIDIQSPNPPETAEITNNTPLAIPIYLQQQRAL